MATTGSQITTAEQLLYAPDLGRCELVQGELIMMSPGGSEHGAIIVRISGPLWTHVHQNALGIVFGAETGFQIARDPDTVRAPDVAFVRAERLEAGIPRGFFQGAPDLAVEVLSPGDRTGEVLAKTGDWLGAGCRMVWVVDPETRTVTVYRSLNDIRVLGAAEQLDGQDVAEGFRLPVGEIFPQKGPR